MLLVRILVGLVFLTEGILKFVLKSELGAGRFARIGFPVPHIVAPFVGIVEIMSGAAVLLNLYTGEAVVLLLCVIVTALITTKFPILIGHGIGPFKAPANTAHYGVLAFLHEARTDLSMLFCLVAILVDSGVRLRPRREWYQKR
jgi:putative oxidoreductase